LAKRITAKMKECGAVNLGVNVICCKGILVLEDYEMGSVQEWKEKVHSINSRDSRYCMDRGSKGKR